MVLRCCVCGIYQQKADENRSFHSFPKSTERRQEWLNVSGFDDVSKGAVLCSDHFTVENFADNLQGPQEGVVRRMLKKNATPYKNELLLQKKQERAQDGNLSNTESTAINKVTELDDKNSIPSQNASGGEELSNNFDVSTDSTEPMIYESVADFKKQQLLIDSDVDGTLQNKDVSENIFESQQEMSMKRKTDETLNAPKKRCIKSNGDQKGRVMNQKKMKNKTKYRLMLDSGFDTFSRANFTSNEKWESFKNYVNRMRRIDSNAKKQKKRLKNTVKNLKSLLKILKKKNFLSGQAQDRVKASLSPGGRQLIEGVLNGKRYSTFPEDLKAFALTLHYYAPCAYNFVRKSFMKILPNPSTLRAWLKSYNYNPGISSEALDSVNKLVAAAALQDKQLYFNLTVDEMSIRKQIRWNKNTNKFEGTIDLGQSGENYDNAEPASNAIVFMLVCINQSFKIPIAYYLVNSLSGEEKSNLLRPILHECYLNSIQVRHMTFDGATSNISMVEELGAQIYDNMSSAYFSHPDTQQPVYTSLDPCHMLKLARTTLDNSDLTDNEGNIISWKYINRLVDLQEKEGMHLATKIRKRHANFQNEKMKVSLAAQTLSTSVAVALEVCETDLELPEFEGAAATAKYCRVIDESFDILNSKNKFCKNPSKQAISKENLEEIKIKVKANVNYISGLKVNDQPICESQKRTAFIGLITALNNVVQLAEDLFNEGHMNFLCTYKLSQDHLETFFSCIRRCGGFNNNPNVMQFQSAYRKLMSHVCVKVSMSANCIPLDGTSLLKPSTKEQKNDAANGSDELLDDVLDLNDHLTALSEIQLSEYLCESIAYVSGAVVKMIEKQIKCKLCLKSLKTEDKEEPISVLQRRKTYGNLVSASRDVILINKTAEKVLRLQETLSIKNLKDKLIVETLRLLPMSKLFSKYDHTYEEEPLCDHRNQLIKLVLNKYFQTRLHHQATSMVDILVRIRKRNNNLTKFQGQ